MKLIIRGKDGEYVIEGQFTVKTVPLSMKYDNGIPYETEDTIKRPWVDRCPTCNDSTEILTEEVFQPYPSIEGSRQKVSCPSCCPDHYKEQMKFLRETKERINRGHVNAKGKETVKRSWVPDKDKIYRFRVKNIEIESVAKRKSDTGGTQTCSFNRMMAKSIGKVLQFHKYDDHVYRDIKESWLYDADWLEPITAQAERGRENLRALFGSLQKGTLHASNRIKGKRKKARPKKKTPR